MKEKYWRYSLIVIILLMGVIIFRQITPFMGGLLGALTIYILVRGQMGYLLNKKNMKRSIAALLIIVETILVFLVPVGLTVWLLVDLLKNINLDPQTFIGPIQQTAEAIKTKTGYDVLGNDTLSFLISSTTYRANYHGQYQQPRYQPVRHDIHPLFHAHGWKKNGSLH